MLRIVGILSSLEWIPAARSRIDNRKRNIEMMLGKEGGSSSCTISYYSVLLLNKSFLSLRVAALPYLHTNLRTLPLCAIDTAS